MSPPTPPRSGAGPGFAQGSNDHSLPVLWEMAKNLNSRGASPRARAPGSGPTRLAAPATPVNPSFHHPCSRGLYVAQGAEWWFLAFRLQEAELQNCLSQQVQ